MDDVDCGDCDCGCCFICIGGGQSSGPARGNSKHRGAACCCVLATFLILATILLVEAYAVVRPVRVAVEDASLARLALANANATALAYDVSLDLALHNPNWEMRAVHTAPLDAELLFAGQAFARVRLGGAGRSLGAGKTDVYRVAAVAAESAPVALGSDGVAEFVRESLAGVFQLELRLAGEFRYRPPHHRSRRIELRCPLTLTLSTSAAAPATFRRVKCV